MPSLEGELAYALAPNSRQLETSMKAYASGLSGRLGWQIPRIGAIAPVTANRK